MAATAVKDLIAVDSTGDIKAVGYVTWFSVPDEPVALRTLRRGLGEAGLPRELAPKDTKAVNAFKRIMSEMDGRKRENGHIRENVVKVVVETRQNLVYQVSTTVRNLEDQVIDFPKAVRVIYLKDEEKIKFNKLPEVSHKDVAPIQEHIEEAYEENLAKVTGAKVRTIVRNYISNTPSEEGPDESRTVYGLNGENLRDRAGGIYFVPAKYADELENVARWLDKLYHGKAFLHMIPMADTASAREIIRRHHQANAVEELKEAIKKISALSGPDRERSARSDAIANGFANYHSIQRRVAEYREILDEELEEAEDLSKMLRKKLDRLM
jgi:hypothetical protein